MDRALDRLSNFLQQSYKRRRRLCPPAAWALEFFQVEVVRQLIVFGFDP
ncbi:MAG TPA: hypothetical protein VLH56_08600 [Dissulfurispiraceae bacterium]|nr:hypothetical protein [Dissulfurispiraceae bacterium]